MESYINKKVLITTQNWFYGKDGKQYKAVHGTLKAVHEVGKTLGFIPNRSHANWFIEVGDMVIMGCQVMYLQRCDEVNTGVTLNWSTPSDSQANKVIEYEVPCTIYIID